MNRRSQGITAMKEDDVNLMNDDMFFEYLIKRYWRPNEKVHDLDRDHYSREFDKDIVVDPIKGCVIYGSYKDGELKRIFIVYRDKKLEKMLKSYQGKFIFTPSKPGTTLNKRYYVTGKDDQVSNRLFVDLIELFLSYSENETLKESHWSEMNRRSQGISVRREDKVESMKDLYDYIRKNYDVLGNEDIELETGKHEGITWYAITIPVTMDGLNLVSEPSVENPQKTWSINIKPELEPYLEPGTYDEIDYEILDTDGVLRIYLHPEDPYVTNDGVIELLDGLLENVPDPALRRKG
jgi:hypothetical protein